MKCSYGLRICFATAIFHGSISAHITTESQTYELQTVHQFPNLTWIENMAMRENGQILATDVAGSHIFLVDPFNITQTSPPVVAQFPKGTTIAGIVEVEEDVFYTVGSLNSNVYNFTFTRNTTTVWQVDMRGYSTSGKPAVRKIVEMPEVEVANGLALLSKQQGRILIADTEAGLIWGLDIHTGAYHVAIDDPLLKPVPTMHPPFGVNGIRVLGSDLYFSNTNQGLLGKIPISTQGSVTGPATTITNSTPAADDFDIGHDGSIWLCENVRNTLVRVFPNGTVTNVAGGANSTALLGPVSARFGRGRFDRDILYVSTDGLLLTATGQALATDGKIVALDTRVCG